MQRNTTISLDMNQPSTPAAQHSSKSFLSTIQSLLRGLDKYCQKCSLTTLSLEHKKHSIIFNQVVAIIRPTSLWLKRQKIHFSEFSQLDHTSRIFIRQSRTARIPFYFYDFLCHKQLSTCWNFERHLSVKCLLIGCRVSRKHAIGISFFTGLH